MTSSGYTTSVSINLARFGSSLKNKPYEFTNLFAEHQQQHQPRHPQRFEVGTVGNLLLGNVPGYDGKATIGKITELALYTRMLLAMNTARKIAL